MKYFLENTFKWHTTIIYRYIYWILKQKQNINKNIKIQKKEIKKLVKTHGIVILRTSGLLITHKKCN